MDNLSLVVKECSYLLDHFPHAEKCKNYLNSRVSEETQKKFNFGYYPNNDNLPSLISLVGQNLLEENGLSYSKEYYTSLGHKTINFSFFENYPIIMPYKNVYGEDIAIVGRSVCSDEERAQLKIAKYKNTIFTKGNHLFGLFENKKEIISKNCVYIVEGQFDVIKSYEMGLRNVVALGSSNLSQKQFALITRYTDNIFLLLDNDDAGRLGRKRILEKYSKLANIRNFYIPDIYKDIDSFFQDNKLSELKLTTYF